ncbi:34451_t:CDS:1, partial [Gigaspora margarita]
MEEEERTGKIVDEDRSYGLTRNTTRNTTRFCAVDYGTHVI